MASTNVALIERIDVHKSCKALENIVNIFNDYCQVAEALALEQKKLARALKEAVGLKATNELAGMLLFYLALVSLMLDARCTGNALSAAASVLESLAEVDAKFVKTADKECDSASNELKKWFKKLAVSPNACIYACCQPIAPCRKTRRRMMNVSLPLMQRSSKQVRVISLLTRIEIQCITSVQVNNMKRRQRRRTEMQLRSIRVM